MNAEARARFLAFAASPRATFRGNFRDLNAAVLRMSTLASAGRIDVTHVDDELARLEQAWHRPSLQRPEVSVLETVLSAEQRADLDPFDRVQLEEVVRVCQRSRSLSDAGRVLFAVSRTKKASSNDADRLRKYLARFDLRFEMLGP